MNADITRSRPKTIATVTIISATLVCHILIETTCIGSPFFQTIASVIESHTNRTSSPTQPSGISNSSLNQCVLHLTTEELNTRKVISHDVKCHITIRKLKGPTLSFPQLSQMIVNFHK